MGFGGKPFLVWSQKDAFRTHQVKSMSSCVGAPRAKLGTGFKSTTKRLVWDGEKMQGGCVSLRVPFLAWFTANPNGWTFRRIRSCLGANRVIGARDSDTLPSGPYHPLCISAFSGHVYRGAKKPGKSQFVSNGEPMSPNCHQYQKQNKSRGLVWPCQPLQSPFLPSVSSLAFARLIRWVVFFEGALLFCFMFSFSFFLGGGGDCFRDHRRNPFLCWEGVTHFDT